MKKIYYALSCLLMLFTVQAANANYVVSTQLDQSTITDGDTIVLETMASTNYDVADGHGNYFNGLTTTSTITKENLFKVIDAQSELGGTIKTYYLMRISDGTYVQGAAAAIQSTTLGIRATSANFQIITYAGNSTNVAAGDNTPGFTEMAVMFKYTTASNTGLFLNSNGAGATTRLVTGTGNWSTWNIYKVAEVKGPKVDLQTLIDSVKTRTYAVGNMPGYVPTAADSTAFADALKSAQATYDLATSTDADYQTALTNLRTAVTNVNAAMIPLKDGWYRIFSAFSAFKTQQHVDKAMIGYNHTDGNSYVAWYTYDPDDESMLWKIEKKADGNYSMYNMWTENYVSGGYAQSGNIYMMAKPRYEQIITPFYTNGEWSITSSNIDYQFHCGGHSSGAGPSGFCVLWTAGAGTASSWHFIPVSDEEVTRLEAIKAQDKLNIQMSALIAKAQKAYEVASPYEKANTSGLVWDSSMWSSNADQNTLGTSDGGGLPALTDGDTNTYWHSCYSATVDSLAPTKTHYLQANIDDGVKTFLFEFTRRISNNNNRPTRITISASNDEAVWDTIKVISSGLPTDATVNGYTSPGIELGKTYTHVRFSFNATNSGAAYKGQPFVTFSEFQLYTAQLTANAQIKTMTTGQALIDAIAKAKTVTKATQADIDALQAAYDAFMKELADPAALKAEITTAQATHDAATEGTIPGTWSADAIAALQTAIDAANAVVKAETLSKTELANALTTLQTAEKTFAAAMKKVPTDDWYYIVSTGTSAVRTGKAMYTTGGKLTDSILFGTLDDNTQSDAHYMWRLVNLGDTAYALQNKGTGYYMGHGQSDGSHATMSDTICVYKLKALGQGSFNIYQQGYNPLHGQETGTVIVFWAGGIDSGSAWTFKSVSETQAVTYDAVSVLLKEQNNKISLVCKPYNITYIDGAKLYSICGASRDANGKATAIKLTEVDKAIAGVPYIMITGNPANYTATPAATDTMSVTFETGTDCVPAPSNANGLIGTYKGTTLANAGMGYSAGSQLASVTTGETKAIGYFSAYIDESQIKDIDGATVALTLPVNGLLDGICCPVTVNDTTPVDVYTISGTRIRANMKASAATAGLPKGVYIIAGKKVIVK
jgi:hypothetical protein